MPADELQEAAPGLILRERRRQHLQRPGSCRTKIDRFITKVGMHVDRGTIKSNILTVARDDSTIGPSTRTTLNA